MSRILGMDVIIISEVIKTKRSWWKRLFWKPWQKFIVTPNPMFRPDEVYTVGNKIFMTSDQYNKLKAESMIPRGPYNNPYGWNGG